VGINIERDVIYSVSNTLVGVKMDAEVIDSQQPVIGTWHS
jgi:hypothetical protein